MANFMDLLKKRRSVRDYQAKEVPTEIVKEIIKESCLAPSSGNGQPWRFIIVNDKATIEKLSNDSKKNLLSHLERNPASPIKKYEAALRNPDLMCFTMPPVWFLSLAPTMSAPLLPTVRLLPAISCFQHQIKVWVLAG